MNKNSKITLFAFIAIGITASAFYWFGVGETRYQGKTVSRWFAEIEIKSNGVTDNDPAVQALVAMGGDAVPHLMKQLSFQDSRPRKLFSTALQKAPWIKIGLMSESDHHLRAYVPLMLMGPKAEQAVPELLHLAQMTNFQGRAYALQLLGYIHSQPEVAMPVLIRFLEASEQNQKLFAIATLGKYGESAVAAAPKLRQFLKDERGSLRMSAATALLGIGDSLDLALPVISNILNNTSSPYRREQVYSLGQLGEKANPAVPLLIEALKAGDFDFRQKVMNALNRINADAAAKADQNQK